jgi:uracil-DNA glycosylase family 4
MFGRQGEKMSESFEIWKESLLRAYGDRAFVSKEWLEKEWGKLQMARTQTHAPVATKKKKLPPVEGAPKVIPEPTRAKQGPETLDDIRADIGECVRCKLCETRTNIVFGEGNPKAKLMFVGEGPGENEDQQGRPFVGRAGQLLDKIIEAMGLKRADVYIANVVKCRPPANRVPAPDESSTCMPFLFRQIETIKPEALVVLGATALKTLVGEDSKISQMRGKFTQFRGIDLMPTFHPAYLLRNPPAKKEVWEDMKKVMSKLGIPERKA